MFASNLSLDFFPGARSDGWTGAIQIHVPFKFLTEVHM